MIHLFHGIVKTTNAKLINTKFIDNGYKCEPKNNVNLKKISITYNTNKCFGMIVKLNIVLITFNGKNKRNIF